MEALRKHRDNTQAGAKQLTEDPQLYWNRMRPICATRLADVAADLQWQGLCVQVSKAFILDINSFV